MFLMAGLQDVAIIISKAENQWYFVWKALGGHGKFLFSQVLCLHRYISLFLSHIIRVCLRTLMIQKPKKCRDPTDRIEDKVVCGLSLEFCQNHELSFCLEPRANCGNPALLCKRILGFVGTPESRESILALPVFCALQCVNYWSCSFCLSFFSIKQIFQEE